MGVTGDGIATLLALSVRTLSVLLALVVGMRILGKRQAGEMRTLDILVVLIVANSVQSSMTKNDGHLTAAFATAGALILAGWLGGVAIDRFPALERRVFGSPVVLAQNGNLVEANMRKEGVTKEDLMLAARRQGLEDIADARLAVLEMDGSISVVRARSTGD